MVLTIAIIVNIGALRLPDLNVVREEKPDVVILVTIERYLPAVGVQ